MQKKKSFFPVFVLFVVLSLLVIFLSSHHILFGQSLFEDGLFPVQNFIFHVALLPGNLFKNTTEEKLQSENLSLNEQLAHLHQLEEDNKALRDQFETTDLTSTTLLPAQVIGRPQFLPGVSAPEALVIDKGKHDGVQVGDTVVYKNNIVGNISHVTDTASQVTIISNKAISVTAKTSTTGAQGVLTGQGNGSMILGNVVLSDKLQIGDMVLAAGSQNMQGKGYPPGLVIGKIISIDRDPSSLYQSASIKSLLQISKLTTVFVITQ